MTADPTIQSTIDYMVEGARPALEQGQSFIPFGAFTRRNGEHGHMQLDLGSRPVDAPGAIAALAQGLKQEADLALAAIAYDGSIQTDDGSVRAVCVHIETGGEAMQVFVPYVLDPAFGLKLHPSITRPAEPAIFG